MNSLVRIARLHRELADAYEGLTGSYSWSRIARLQWELAAAFSGMHGETVPEPLEPPNAPGVYCVLGAGAMVKIGKAEDIQTRLALGQTWQPSPLRLLAVLATDPSREVEFHRRFSRDRAHGEWFRLSPEILEAIREARAA